jgi:tRNA(Ile)-lysidine synthase
LLHVLDELEHAGDLRVSGVAHFNHQLRPAADDDERFCVSMAATLGRPILVGRENVAMRAERERRSVEDAGHQARYQFFEQARAHFGGDRVALGHTLDDQAETFLLRLIRGAGPKGLGGMHPSNGAVIRPLLSCRRAELRSYLDARHIPFREDETNRDLTVPRNRVRAELVPLLQSRFNPAIVDVLAAEAELARDEWQWMENMAAADAGAGNLEIAALLSAPLALRRVVVWRAMSKASAGRPVSFAHVEAVLRMLDPAAPDAGLDAPGQRVERRGHRLVLRSIRDDRTPRPGRRPSPAMNRFRYRLSVPGEVHLAEAGCVLSADVAPPAALPGLSAATSNGAVALVRSDLSTGQLAVRNRRPGDRFSPVGLGGRKKLQDFFVDRKVPRERRDAVPLVVDDADRIIWVAGYGIDERFRVTDPSQGVVILRLKPAGEASF